MVRSCTGRIWISFAFAFAGYSTLPLTAFFKKRRPKGENDFKRVSDYSPIMDFAGCWITRLLLVGWSVGDANLSFTLTWGRRGPCLPVGGKQGDKRSYQLVGALEESGRAERSHKVNNKVEGVGLGYMVRV